MTSTLKLHSNCMIPTDKTARAEFCIPLINIMNTDPNILYKLMMSDEAKFHLSCYVNKQNSETGTTNDPPLHCAKVTVWCGMSAYGNRAVTLTSEWYRIKLEMLEADDETWFQQTAPQRTQLGNQWTISLRAMLPGNLISRFGNNAWPSTSPDLTALDFFLWGYETCKVYVNKPHTITEVKEHIANEMKVTEAELLRQDFKNVSHVVENTYKYYC
jgi:hypothetical protein